MPLPEKIRRKIARLAGVSSNYTKNDAAADEMNAILLQLTMALMMIFLIAFSLFRLKTTEELEPVAVIKAEQQLNFQRQELLLALERTDEYYRIRYGLKTFAGVDASDRVAYDISPLIQDGKPVDNPLLRNIFTKGAKACFEDYSHDAELPGAWRGRAMIEAGIDESTLQSGNSAWLDNLIVEKIRNVRHDAEILQYQAAALIQTFLAAHPDQVADSGVRSLLEQYVSSPPATQKVLVNELDRSLKDYAFGVLAKQTGVPLMKDIGNE